MNVDFLLFEGMDLMDFSGPWEVFLTANRLLERQGNPRLSRWWPSPSTGSR